MTDAKRKDQAMRDHPNLGQDEADEEREGKEKMEHMEGDTPHRVSEKSQRDKDRAPQRPAQTSRS
jgi:hypothetical protein